MLKRIHHIFIAGH